MDLYSMIITIFIFLITLLLIDIYFMAEKKGIYSQNTIKLLKEISYVLFALIIFLIFIIYKISF